jgi:threonine/homoserine/homoserine lactone efflux protein
MPSATQFGVFLAAALVLAAVPGPGMLYVLARSLAGGRSVGIASSCGTAVGGLGNLVAAAAGLSALIAGSAVLFTAVKLAGAAYLIYLGLRTLVRTDDVAAGAAVPGSTAGRAFRQGILTELLNPKTALFFLAFLPQFINPHAAALPQLLVLGTISVALNTGADLVVAAVAGPIGSRLRTSRRFRRRQRLASGGTLIGLGAYVAVTGSRQ